MTIREFLNQHASFEKSMAVEQWNPPLSDALYVLTKLKNLLHQLEEHTVCSRSCGAGRMAQLALNKKDVLTLKELSKL